MVSRTGKSRGQEAYIDETVYRKLIRSVNPNFADLLRFLHDAGCRPAEAYHAQARYDRPSEKVVVCPGQPEPGELVWKDAR